MNKNVCIRFGKKLRDLSLGLKVDNLRQVVQEFKEKGEALRESEESSRRIIQAILEPRGDIGILNLGDIIDQHALQAMMDDFYQITKVPNAVVEQSGKILAHAGWKFSASEKTACIEFGSTMQEGKETFYIRDNGTGFDMKHAEKLFTAFQRLHDA